jgi:integrase
MPRFATFSKRYLDEATEDLAMTTRRDRASYLRKDGPLLTFFGARALDEITPGLIREWWATAMTQTDARRSSQKTPRRWTAPATTARRYLDGLEGVLSYAAELGFIEASPVPMFRHTLRKRGRTKRARAAADPAQHIRPIEDAHDIERLLEAAEGEGTAAKVLVLLCLDGGLRLGEALGLPWAGIRWGTGPDDRSRALHIAISRPRGGEPETTKSGRARTVALSRRLREALRALHRERFAPKPDALVLEGVDPDNFRHREWRRICQAAKVGGRALKDLRDTFASQLLTGGIQLGYVSEQLGHADVAVTAKHYARWIGGAEYREPLQIAPGEVPADLLARLDHESQPGTLARADAN